MKDLRHLNLYSTGIRELPRSITSCSNLEKLQLGESYLEELPDDLGELQNLVLLDVSSTPIKEVPESIILLRKLTSLNFNNCGNLHKLPKDIGAAMRHVRILDIGTTQIRTLPDLYELSSLEYVDLGKAMLPRDVRNWNKLEHLKYDGHRKMSSKGWEESSLSSSFPCLKKLSIEICPKLVTVPDVALKHDLAHLQINGISELESLPRQNLQPELKYLKLWGCPKFQGFHSNEEESNLNNISVATNSSLEDSIYLEELQIQCPQERNSLSVDLQCIRDLQDFKIGWFSEEPGSFPFSIEQFSSFASLQRLEIDGCSKLKILPEQLQHLTSLKEFTISNMGLDMVVLPEWIGDLSRLVRLETRNCENLVHMPSKETMLRLKFLKFLFIEACPLLEQSCNCQAGEDWDKISQIKYIRFL
ncbi:hypothetical protein MKW98_028959 [Papaver atlanticum]|uniref:Disease resistance R13L4/SHOC-2-like LRR domain-containing protein n=1 Tax=Papaver atlanticum TaxID=357466 RepID=A0AAD4XWJ4_9MAGN|nr:hypothetical protein MKW98_028959 [Papaver atlanticum]